MQDLYIMLVKNVLKKYVFARDYIILAKERIEELNAKKEGKIIVKYGDKLCSTDVKENDRLLNILAEIDLYATNIKENEKIIADVDSCMKGFSDMQKEIIVEIYGKPYKQDKITYLTSKYHYSKSKIYKIAGNTIEIFSMRMFGNY